MKKEKKKKRKIQKIQKQNQKQNKTSVKKGITQILGRHANRNCESSVRETPSLCAGTKKQEKNWLTLEKNKVSRYFAQFF